MQVGFIKCYIFLQDNNALGEIFLPGNQIIKINTTADMNGKYVFEIAGE